MASNFCRNCGYRLTPGRMFCGNCGTVVSAAPAPVQAPVMPVAAPVVAAPAYAPVYSVPAAAPVAEPASPAPAAVSETVAEPVISVNPQPMQTVVTYHPEESVTGQLPAEAIIPEAPVQEKMPEASSVPDADPAAPADIPAPKKKKHTGLIIGLICAGVSVILIAVIAVVAFNLIVRSGKGSTVLERIEVLDEVSSGKRYTIYNKDFNKKIKSARWWDYDGTMKNQGVYNADTETLAFSIKVDDKTSEKLYFAFYYSEDSNFNKEDLGKPVYSDTIAPSYYEDGTAYYNIECSKSLKPGYYCVIVSKDKSFRKPYAVAYAEILKKD